MSIDLDIESLYYTVKDSSKTYKISWHDLIKYYDRYKDRSDGVGKESFHKRLIRDLISSGEIEEYKV